MPINPDLFIDFIRSPRKPNITSLFNEINIRSLIGYPVFDSDFTCLRVIIVPYYIAKLIPINPFRSKNALRVSW